MYTYSCTIQATIGLGHPYETFTYVFKDKFVLTDRVLKIMVVTQLPKEYISWKGFTSTLEKGEI